MDSTKSLRARLFAGAAISAVLATQAIAQNAPPKHHHRKAVDSVSARLDRLEHVIEEQQAEIHRLRAQVGNTQVAAQSGGAIQPATNPSPDVSDADVQQLQAEVEDLKRAQAAQYADIQTQRQSDVQTTFKNGRPTFKTANGNFSASLRALVQYDSAYYMQGMMPPGIDFSSGSNFRRARLGFSGTLFKDWSYEFLYDLGGSGVEAAAIASAYLQYDGLGPVHMRLGAYPTPESFEDSTSASDLLFLERAQPVDLERSIAGSDGRQGATVFAYDDNYFAALSYTGGLVGESAVFDEEQNLVGRAAYRFILGDDVNFAVGADSTYVIRPADTAAGNESPESVRLRERPELNVDDNGIRLIDTGTLNANHMLTYGFEAAGNWHSLYGQGGYFHYDVSRRDSPLSNPSFDGWYAQASWVLTGESKPYRPERGAYGSPIPADEFSFDKIGWGAWEIAARYSVLDLNFDAGAPGTAAVPDAIRGGDQKIWTAGLNWYPNAAIRFMLDYQHTDVSRLDSAGSDLGARLDAVSLRAQVAF
ncbi:MAG TPA: porin [Rhizomicrobium sp.]|jgi:phosphate-selective porin OprO/OprP|nr:porin [Rhizomicrobium sp.]